jgi:aspartate racemase
MTLGVLGGLGPGATVHFMSRLLEMTPASSDQEHIETLVYNDPTVPDRTEAILGNGSDPTPKLVENAKKLDEVGCDSIVIDSNTTHYYYDAISESVSAEVPHLVQLVESEVRLKEWSSVGVLTTKPAKETGLYENVAENVVYPTEMGLLMKAMYAYKAGEKKHAKQMYDAGIQSLPGNVDGYIIACTDFSALPQTHSKPTIDGLEVLVNWCIDRYT